MSILYYLLVIFGSAIAGFIIGVSAFLIVSKINDFRFKRKSKKLDQEYDMLKPKITNIERGESIEDGEPTATEFREFEKLRSIAKGERRTEPISNSITDERRFDISNEPSKQLKSDKQNFRFY